MQQVVCSEVGLSLIYPYVHHFPIFYDAQKIIQMRNILSKNIILIFYYVFRNKEKCKIINFMIIIFLNIKK